MKLNKKKIKVPPKRLELLTYGLAYHTKLP